MSRSGAGARIPGRAGRAGSGPTSQGPLFGSPLGGAAQGGVEVAFLGLLELGNAAPVIGCCWDVLGCH